MRNIAARFVMSSVLVLTSGLCVSIASAEEAAKETPKESSNPKETPKETPKDSFKETVKEVLKQMPQDLSKELAQVTPTDASKELPKGGIVVGYFSAESAEVFNKKIKPAFDEFKGNCKTCDIVNLTPYDDKGVYVEKELSGKVKNLPGEVTFLLFSWNSKQAKQNAELIANLSEKVAAGKILIAATGQAKEGEAGAPLNRTIMGQVKDGVIIGELTERDRLLPQSYFGPEMLTAIRPPKEYIGKEMSPLYFSARLAGVWKKRAPIEWLQHFKTKKIKSRKIWLDVEDLLGR